MSSYGDSLDLNALLLYTIDYNYHDTDTVYQLLQEGVDVNAVDRRGTTPLMRASILGRDRIVCLLLDAGANARCKDKGGYTAVHRACAGSHLIVVQLLINHDRTLLNQASKFKETPLIVATEVGDTEICRYLIGRGCKLNVADARGNTALFIAATHGHFRIVRLLFDAGVNMDARDDDRQTALHRAARYNRLDVVRELILHNANMCPLDRNGKTPFDVAYIAANSESTAEFMFEMYNNRLSQGHEAHLALHGILRIAEYSFYNFETDGDRVHPPLHPLRVKIPLGNVDWKYMRTLLLSVDEELLRRRDDNGRLPIHIACQTNAPVEVLATLVERDTATLLMADYTGELPVHDCCRCYRGATHCVNALQYLVDCGGVGTLAARNRDGALPLHVWCGAFTTTPVTFTVPVVRYLMESFPGSVAMQTNAGQYPFMIAASKASLSVIYEIVRSSPLLAVPR